jgi:hypothetical protein
MRPDQQTPFSISRRRVANEHQFAAFWQRFVILNGALS